MAGDVIILGAKGRFGRAAVDAFLASGWRVRVFARSWSGTPGGAGVDRIAGDGLDAPGLAAAAMGCEVIVNALNPPYPKWAQDVPRLTASVIAAAKQSNATVMVPGNVYNYGAGMPERLTEQTPHAPTTRKGRLREEMERTYAEAGVQTVILRAGDFMERQKTGNWFDSYVAAHVAKGRVVYPGPLDRVHAWAYLPDLARAMAALADKRNELARFESFGFPGYGLTGEELVDALARACGRGLKVKSLPWPMIRMLGLVLPQMREVGEMSYLWRVPHAIDGSKLAAVLPDFQTTPLAAALTEMLDLRAADLPDLVAAH